MREIGNAKVIDSADAGESQATETAAAKPSTPLPIHLNNFSFTSTNPWFRHFLQQFLVSDAWGNLTPNLGVLRQLIELENGREWNNLEAGFVMTLEIGQTREQLISSVVLRASIAFRKKRILFPFPFLRLSLVRSSSSVKWIEEKKKKKNLETVGVAKSYTERK